MLPFVSCLFHLCEALLFPQKTTDEDVKAFKAAEAEKELQRKIKMAKRTIEKAEKQDKIRTAAETRKYLRNLNNVLNEGGEGWLPKLVTLEEYEEAKNFLKEHE